MNDRSHILHGYMETLFTRRIHEEFSSEYKLTAAIAQHLTTKFHHNEQHDVRSDGTVALRYPSVVDIADSFNTVMHRAFAQERLKLVHVAELTVSQIEGTRVFCSVTDNAYDIVGDTILWSADPQAYPAPRPEGHAPFIYDGDKWRILVSTDPGGAWSPQEMIDENTAKPNPSGELLAD